MVFVWICLDKCELNNNSRLNSNVETKSCNFFKKNKSKKQNQFYFKTYKHIKINFTPPENDDTFACKIYSSSRIYSSKLLLLY